MSKRQIPNFAFVLFGLVTVCGGCTLQYHDIGSGQSETFALGQRSASTQTTLPTTTQVRFSCEGFQQEQILYKVPGDPNAIAGSANYAVATTGIQRGELEPGCDAHGGHRLASRECSDAVSGCVSRVRV